MRRRMLALALSLMALTVIAPAAGADGLVDTDTDETYICVRSRMILGDPVCIKYYPGV